MFLTRRGKKRAENPPGVAISFERRLLLSILLAGLPGVALAFVLLWTGSYSQDHKIEGTVAVLLAWLALASSARNIVVHSVRVLSNIVSGLREEDFSFRAVRATRGDALGDMAIEINHLARALEGQRLQSVEAINLLRQVMAEAGAIIIAFSPDGAVRLLNRPALSLLGRTEEQAIGLPATELGIADLMEGPASETMTRAFRGIEKRWIIRRTYFRQHGIPHRLVVLSEASEALRREERLAWQRIVRVLSHEINNSLAPIKSIARTLRRISGDITAPDHVLDNFRQGLDVIAGRAESLNRFLQSYTRLAKLPPPNYKSFQVKELLESLPRLEPRLHVTIVPGLDVCIHADPDQLEQALINLTINAVDSVLARPEYQAAAVPLPSDAVSVSWEVLGKDLIIHILDSGSGILDTENLFVPFYTTKPTGSGIGLLLSRQIVEGHGGTLQIQNRPDSIGCQVKIRLPGCVDLGHNYGRVAGETR